MISDRRPHIGCQTCPDAAMEVADGDAVLVGSVEAEVLPWRCRGCGGDGESLVPLEPEDLDLVA